MGKAEEMGQDRGHGKESVDRPPGGCVARDHMIVLITILSCSLYFPILDFRRECGPNQYAAVQEKLGSGGGSEGNPCSAPRQ